MEPLTYEDYLKWRGFFTYNNYRKLINKWKDEFTILRFKDVVGFEGKGLILRHDVDFLVDSAIKMAEIEIELGIRSTYFVLVSAYSYNILNSKIADQLSFLISNGFEVGLHFDPSIYPEAVLNDKFKLERSILEEVLGVKVNSVALHNPSVHNQYPIFDNILNAYDKRFFVLEKYLSDSRIDFFGKDPITFFNNIKAPDIVQVVLHPEQWGFNGCNYLDIEIAVLEAHRGELRTYAKATKMYKYVF